MPGDGECTCPPDPPHTGPGVPIRAPGTLHRRGCPVVAGVFEAMDSIARKHAAEHVRKGGFLQDPAESLARENSRRIDEIERRLDALEAPDAR